MPTPSPAARLSLEELRYLLQTDGFPIPDPTEQRTVPVKSHT